jgi:hypothetical protein
VATFSQKFFRLLDVFLGLHSSRDQVRGHPMFLGNYPDFLSAK